MQIKWRQHELLLAGIVTLLYIVGIILRDASLSPEMIRHVYEPPFKTSDFPFIYSRNVLLPDIGQGLLFFACLFYTTRYIIPRILDRRKNIIAAIHLLLLFLLLTAGLAITNYFFFQYEYHSGIFPNKPIRYAWFNAMPIAFRIMLAYAIYAGCREWVIPQLEKNDSRRAYLVLIANRITGAAVTYFSIFAFAVFFRLLQDRSYFAIYAFFIPAALITYYSCLYWFFPYKGNAGFFQKNTWLLYFCSLLAVSIPFDVFFISVMKKGDKFYHFLFICTLVQTVLSTGLAWITYHREKEKIDMLRGLQTELGRSNADLQFLRSQINPHFLFNALNTLYGTALQENAERTAEGVQKLGDMMRFMLHENTREMIGLQREIDYLENYISLQTLRTQSSPSIKIEAQIADITGHFSIAPMLLIPFVENAFKHGISLEKPSFIKIMLQKKENNLYFDVHNSIHHSSGQDTEKVKSGIGLQNVKHRLELIYPNRHELIIHQTPTEFFIHLTVSLQGEKQQAMKQQDN